MLVYTRLLMFVLICVVYALHIPHEELGLQIFVGAACFMYVVNHCLLMMSHNGERRLFFILLLNGIVTTIFGFLFPNNDLYLILFGVDAVTLFINVRSKVTARFFIGFFFLCWFAILIYSYQYFGAFEIWGNIISFMFVVFSALTGGLIKKLTLARQTVDEQYEKLTSSHEALQEAHEQLQLYAKEVEELTAVKERNEIAREIHDTVGHNMTALLVQLQLAEELWKQKSNQTEVVLQTCHELAKKSLQEVRASVRTLKEEENVGDLVGNIKQMLNEFSNVTNVRTTFKLHGDPAIIPLSLHPIILRIMQESLTNAKRHGKANTCEMKLSCLDGKVHIFISDDGAGVNEVHPGFGLINMKERVEERGGMIRFESEKDKGFQLNVEFPLREKTWVIGGAV
ncbi:sensor histidine kinase [Bacillus sp. 123MFChir2]|uniref:sensor histidine kinase n=1 Tax=Bacillus sp. 123MFChir2 TaxID=1169144 RepID=UPI00036B7DEE|nr:sensor histidine kinase [Bacillus sp. 123MFChir2]